MHFGLPQNRQRVFIVGVSGDEFANKNRTGGTLFSTRLAVSNDLAGLPQREREDAADTSSWRPIEDHGERFQSWGLAASGHFFAADLDAFSAKQPEVSLRSILESAVAKDFDFTESTLKWLANNTPVNRFVQGVEILSNQAGGARMGYTIFGTGGVAPTLTSTTSRHYERYKIGDRYRRLTNVEYARIQGFPDDHCSAASIYDQYALFGNAVPPPMVAWVMRRLSSEIVWQFGPRGHRQQHLFKHAYEGTA
jgi:DNA (cytosine-5)-methyltransferase 1